MLKFYVISLFATQNAKTYRAKNVRLVYFGVAKNAVGNYLESMPDFPASGAPIANGERSASLHNPAWWHSPLAKLNLEYIQSSALA